MSSDPHTLLYRPPARWSVTRGSNLLLGDSAGFARQRDRSLSVGTSGAYAFIGADLLPDSDRPTHGGGVLLLWVPSMPSQCLITARDGTGAYRVVPAPARGGVALARALERLEVASACAFDEALVVRPDYVAVLGRLEQALEHASVVALLIGEMLGSEPFWRQREPTA